MSRLEFNYGLLLRVCEMSSYTLNVDEELHNSELRVLLTSLSIRQPYLPANRLTATRCGLLCRCAISDPLIQPSSIVSLQLHSRHFSNELREIFERDYLHAVDDAI